MNKQNTQKLNRINKAYFFLAIIMLPWFVTCWITDYTVGTYIGDLIYGPLFLARAIYWPEINAEAKRSNVQDWGFGIGFVVLGVLGFLFGA